MQPTSSLGLSSTHFRRRASTLSQTNTLSLSSIIDAHLNKHWMMFEDRSLIEYRFVLQLHAQQCSRCQRLV